MPQLISHSSFLVGASDYAVVLPWETLTSIQRLILIHVLCPAALTATARHFVLEHMGAPFLSSGIADLSEMFEESSAKRPLIFILSPGTYSYFTLSPYTGQNRLQRSPLEPAKTTRPHHVLGKSLYCTHKMMTLCTYTEAVYATCK